MGQELEHSSIAKRADGQFSYHYFNHHPDIIDFYESLSLQGGGDTWAALAKAGLSLAQSERMDDIEFDPEAEALYAYSDSRAALEELAAIVKRIAVDNGFRDQCLSLAEESGELE